MSDSKSEHVPVPNSTSMDEASQVDLREPRPPVDMSPEAIDRRLRIVSELYTLGMAIKSGRFVEES